MKNTKLFSRILKVTALSAAIVNSGSALAWGQTGHRITGELAQHYLSDQAIAEIDKLYPDSSLAEISTLADEMRSNPSEFWQKTAGPWHYVTVKDGVDYHAEHAPEYGDAYTALLAFKATLRNPQASVDQKRLALHFIVHIIGDLHQPLHAGNGTDRGGNDVKLEFFWEDSNLHRVWDSGLIDRQQLSFTEWTNWLNKKISPEMAKQWQETDPKVWIKESATLRDTIYPEGDRLSWDYNYQHLPEVKTRLQMAGVRVAAYLNELFKK